MSKHKNSGYEADDEFLAQLDFLRYDYDKSLETIEQQTRDIQKLLALLIERDIPIPGNIADRYIRRAAETGSDGEAELPFD